MKRRVSMGFLAVLLLCLLASCGSERAEEPAEAPAQDHAGAATPGEDGDVPIDSFVLVDVTERNARIAEAVADGETWPSDPIDLALWYLEFGGAPEMRISKTDAPGEAASTTTVTVIRDRLLDDSVRGIWDQLVLTRQPDGTWRIEEARRAYRCWRGFQLDAFGDLPCR
jgi:hypothetical protein